MRLYTGTYSGLLMVDQVLGNLPQCENHSQCEYHKAVKFISSNRVFIDSMDQLHENSEVVVSSFQAISMGVQVIKA